MATVNKDQFQIIVDEAFQAAHDASNKYIAEHGEPAYCGFAWVTIKPGTSGFAKFLKAKDYARNGFYGGVEVWNPGKSFTQSMDVKEAGAVAFADVLRKYSLFLGVKIFVGSRAD